MLKYEVSCEAFGLFINCGKYAAFACFQSKITSSENSLKIIHNDIS